MPWGAGIQSAATPNKNDLYYSSSWQVLEEDYVPSVGASQQTQYVWSAAYVDALVERDVGATREYVQQDANWNTTAAVNVSGSHVDERYVYDPYGSPTYYTSTWTLESSSSLNWVYLFQGGRYDGYQNGVNGWVSIGAYTYRNRDDSPTLGLWLEQDPIGFSGGSTNLYEYISDSPDNGTDPTGLLEPLPGGPSSLKGGLMTQPQATLQLLRDTLIIVDIVAQPMVEPAPRGIPIE